MTTSIAIPSLSGGGAEKVTLLLVKELVRRGEISKVYVGSRCEASDALDCEVVILGGRRASQGLFNFLKNVIQDPAESFMLTLGYINFTPFLRIVRPNARIVVRIGNTPTPEIVGLSRSARYRYLISTRFATHMATEVVAQCNFMATDLRSLLGLPKTKIRIIYNPIEPSLADWPEYGATPISGPYLFVAATFKPQKDLETLISGFARSENKFGRKLVIAGVGPDDTSFMQLLDRYHLNRQQVLCLGFRKDTYNLIRDSDLCVLTSKYEGFSNFLLEAAALGKRIIATDCPGGNAELFHYYHNVSTFPVGDNERLAGLIEQPRQDVARFDAISALESFSFDAFLHKFFAALGAQTDPCVQLKEGEG